MIWLALIHHPVRDRAGATATTAVTNLDVHDLSRLARTYGLAGYFVVTPITAQRAIVGRILSHWREGAGARKLPVRGEALSLCEAVASVDDAVTAVRQRAGGTPLLVATSARHEGPATPWAEAARRMRERPSILLFGTGHGLSSEAIERCDLLLPPIRPGGYNHLSVRTAAAIAVDRLFGDG